MRKLLVRKVKMAMRGKRVRRKRKARGGGGQLKAM